MTTRHLVRAVTLAAGAVAAAAMAISPASAATNWKEVNTNSTWKCEPTIQHNEPFPTWPAGPPTMPGGTFAAGRPTVDLLVTGLSPADTVTRWHVLDQHRREVGKGSMCIPVWASRAVW